MADGPDDTPRAAGRKRPWYVTVLLAELAFVVVLGVLLAVLDLVGGASLNREVEAIRAAGQPVTIDDLNARCPEVPDDKNGGLILLGLADRFKAFRTAWNQDASLPSLSRICGPAPGEACPASTVAAITAARERGADLIVEVDRLREPLPSCLHIRVEGLSLTSGRPPYGMASKLKALDCLAKVRDGDADGAALDSLVILNVASVAQGEGTLIEALVASRCDRLALDTLQRALAGGELDVVTLSTLTRALEPIEASRTMAEGMQAERALALEACESLARPRGDEGSLPGYAPSSGFSTIRYLRGLRRLNEAKILELMRPLAAPGISVAEGIARAKAVEAQYAALPSYQLLPRILVPSHVSTFEAHGRRIAMLRCTRVGLAVECFRMARGEWPATLDDIAPQYLEQLPGDPFGEQPLRYRHDGQGVTIYSVGPDISDDGGQVFRGPSTNKHPPDVGVRLVEPRLRGFRIAEDSPE